MEATVSPERVDALTGLAAQLTGTSNGVSSHLSSFRWFTLSIGEHQTTKVKFRPSRNFHTAQWLGCEQMGRANNCDSKEAEGIGRRAASSCGRLLELFHLVG